MGRNHEVAVHLLYATPLCAKGTWDCERMAHALASSATDMLGMGCQPAAAETRCFLDSKGSGSGSGSGQWQWQWLSLWLWQWLWQWQEAPRRTWSLMFSKRMSYATGKSLT